MSHPDETGSFETAADRTLYWTLSIYLDAQTVARRCGQPPMVAGSSRLQPVPPTVFRDVQRKHLPSLALRNAIEPLFNDIADRERLGAVQDFLLAAGHRDWHLGDERSLQDAAAKIRLPEAIEFMMPSEFSWTTEGHRFTCRLGDKELPREVKLRRFWFAHSNGALSYHLAFSHHYGRYLDGGAEDRSAVEPLETYYFLSLLQKLAAPKEFSLEPDAGERSVFDEGLGIDPLDHLKVRHEGSEQRFWPFVRAILDRDAADLFANLVSVLGIGWQRRTVDLLDTAMVELIEVPGLKLPRSRCLFHIHDERFFNRLLPLDPETETPIPRKKMVQDWCYQPYSERIDALRKAGSTVHIGIQPRIAAGEWLKADWLTNREDYRLALKLEPPMFVLGAPDGPPIGDLQSLRSAMRKGTCWILRSTNKEKDYEALPTPVRLHVPAFEENRRDCLDYLFLSGFNQNIIDWLNQDPSEVLDSTDPIYPTEDDQADERFFVRYANHRAMITYVPRSRSLEIGNDYIGTCPYAFLIHVLALHNEYLAREQELYADQQIRLINVSLNQLSHSVTRSEEGGEAGAKERAELEAFARVETDINDLKAANYEEFEKHRYQNVFRYDTERSVFAALETLRGMSRRTLTLNEAIHTLEDKSRDVELRRLRAHERAQKDLEREDEKSQARLSNLLGLIGASSVLGLLFNVASFLEERYEVAMPSPNESLGEYVAGNLAMVFVIFVLGGVIWWGIKLLRERRTQRSHQRLIPPKS